MFDHIQQQRRPSGPNRALLVLATVSMLGVFALIVYACLWVLSLLGLTNIVQPVEVSFDPYGDGTELQDLLGPDEVPEELHDSGGLSPE